MLIYYTTSEGGHWIPRLIPYDKGGAVGLLSLFWVQYGPLPFLVVGPEVVNVHSVLFPDSDVWDASIGRLRGTDEPDYYQKVQEAVGGIDEN